MMRTIGNACILIAAMCINATAGDWPVWRGKNGDGISTETNWSPKAITAKKIKWQKELGVGYSAVSTHNGFTYTMGNKKDTDIIYCLDSSTGKTVWTHTYPCKEGRYKGPRATPVVVDGYVYALSREGHALCLDAEKGNVIWSKNLISDFGAVSPKWGFSSTPVVAEGVVLYNAGEYGIALDAKSGTKRWGKGGKGSYAVPVIYKNSAIMFVADKAVALDIQTGQRVWSYPWKTKYDVNAADPVVLGDKLLLSSGYGTGSVMLDLSSGKPRKLWQNKALKSHFSTPVYLNGVIFGVDGQSGSKGSLVCVDLKGNIKWSHKTGFASLMAADNKLIILTDRGDLLIADASPTKFQKIAEIKTGLGKTCWTQPILSNGLIYCRKDKGTLLAFDVTK